MKAYFQIVVALVIMSQLSNAQTSFGVFVEPDSISGMPGLQSFAYARSQGKWLLIGGRTDGLHRRQPPSSFLPSGNNLSIYVIDPVAKQVYQAPLTSLSVSLQEQLQSTNMQFAQHNGKLILTGGYGYSATAADHITYPNLTEIDVDSLMQAVINNQPFAQFIKQINDVRFAVTGGHLAVIHDVFYLVGGHRFDGRYNPMNGPSFVQTYTNQIRKFQIVDSASFPSIVNYSTYTDNVNLHRRDYNLSPQIYPNGQYGFTIFSGVFQQGVDLPYLNSVDIDSGGYYVNNNFNQYLSHYHSANASVFDAQQNEMHTLFFGGMSQYEISPLGILVQNDSVPFVKTISKVTRSSNGSMNEIKIGEMPALLGASAEFILNENVPTIAGEIVDLNQITVDTLLLGYIVGGIKSNQQNIFWINTGVESSASIYFYKVWLIKNLTSGINEQLVNGKNPLHVKIYPNPVEDNLRVKYTLNRMAKATFIFQDFDGRLLETFETDDMQPGTFESAFSLKKYDTNSILLTVSDGINLVTEKIIVR